MKRKILFVITSMGLGGAERVVSYLCNYFSADNVDVSLLLLKSVENTYLDRISDSVTVYNLGIKGRLRWNLSKIVTAIRDISPDICLVGLDGLNILLAPCIPYLKKSIKGLNMIVRETNVLSSMWGTGFIKKLPYKLFYNNYDRVICQSNDMACDLVDNWGVLPRKIIVINNPVNTAHIANEADEPLPEKIRPVGDYYICVGRLTYQKGFDRLISYIDMLVKEGLFPYRLIILGDGVQRDELESMIRDRHLEDFVRLLGRRSNPYQFLKNAKGLILSSYFEGFPNVLLEANALGLPVLANSCPGGINEIVIDGKNGISADFSTYESFKEAFVRFERSSFDRQWIREMNRSRYDVQTILPKFKQLFCELK